MSDKKLHDASDRIETRLAERRAQLEADIPGITAFVHLLKEKFTVEGVRRGSLGSIPISPLLMPNEMMKRRRKK